MSLEQAVAEQGVLSKVANFAWSLRIYILALSFTSQLSWHFIF